MAKRRFYHHPQLRPGIWLSDAKRAKGILETGGELLAAGISRLLVRGPEPAWVPLEQAGLGWLGGFGQGWQREQARNVPPFSLPPPLPSPDSFYGQNHVSWWKPRVNRLGLALLLSI